MPPWLWWPPYICIYRESEQRLAEHKVLIAEKEADVLLTERCVPACARAWDSQKVSVVGCSILPHRRSHRESRELQATAREEYASALADVRRYAVAECC